MTVFQRHHENDAAVTSDGSAVIRAFKSKESDRSDEGALDVVRPEKVVRMRVKSDFNDGTLIPTGRCILGDDKGSTSRR